MPGTTQHFPSFMVEVAYNNESPEQLISDANVKYFTVDTSVQVWLGIKIFHNDDPAERKFWAIWGVRSLFGVGMIHNATTIDGNGFEAMLNVEGGPVAGSFTIPSVNVYYPHPVPAGVPDLVILFETLRAAIRQGYLGI